MGLRQSLAGTILATVVLTITAQAKNTDFFACHTRLDYQQPQDPETLGRLPVNATRVFAGEQADPADQVARPPKVGVIRWGPYSDLLVNVAALSNKPSPPISGAPVRPAPARRPAAGFQFDDGLAANRREAREMASGTPCPVLGNQALWKKGVSGEAFEGFSRTGPEADIIVRDIGPDKGRFVFWRGSGDLPYLVTKGGKWFVPGLTERKGDGPRERPHSVNTCSVARIIESSVEKVVNHYRQHASTAFFSPIHRETDDPLRGSADGRQAMNQTA